MSKNEPVENADYWMAEQRDLCGTWEGEFVTFGRRGRQLKKTTNE